LRRRRHVRRRSRSASRDEIRVPTPRMAKVECPRGSTG
jgi:hypothetical protein